MDTYTIKSIDAKTGRITVSFSCDGKDQVLADYPIEDLMALDTALNNYGIAYKAGLVIQAASVVDPKVTAIVGTPQTI